MYSCEDPDSFFLILTFQSNFTLHLKGVIHLYISRLMTLIAPDFLSLVELNITGYNQIKLLLYSLLENYNCVFPFAGTDTTTLLGNGSKTKNPFINARSLQHFS